MDVKVFLHAQWDRILGWLSIVAGVIAIWLGWLGISGTALSFEQIPYVISGGLFGIALIAIGSTVLLSADLRDEWRKLDRLAESVSALLDDEMNPRFRSSPRDNNGQIHSHGDRTEEFAYTATRAVDEGER